MKLEPLDYETPPKLKVRRSVVGLLPPWRWKILIDEFLAVCAVLLVIGILHYLWQMKKNPPQEDANEAADPSEARPIFRILAGFMAIPASFACIGMTYHDVFNRHFDWNVLELYAGTIMFWAITIRGRKSFRD